MSWRERLGRNWGRLGMKYKLSDICFYVKGKVDVSGLTDADYISTENMMPNKGGVTIASSLPSTAQTQAYRKDDVLVSNIRPYFKKIWFADCNGGCSNDVLVFRAKEDTDARFLYYVLADDAFFDYSTATSKGTKMPRGDKTPIMQYEVPHFDLPIQKKIAGILADIDNKISLNNNINKNLEQQAQAIFDDMFPDLFSLNTDATLQDLIVFANGKKRPKTIGNIPVYGGNGILAYTDKSNADNCVIIGRVGAYCGNTFLCLDKCWTSDNAIQAKSRTGSSPLFIYYLLRNASLSSRHIGTGQPLMTQGILNAIPIKYPVEEKISAFIETCSPIHKMISGNRQQNESLASIRDSMLPKLMSGEMDVSELNL